MMRPAGHAGQAGRCGARDTRSRGNALFPVALVSSEDRRALLALIVRISGSATPHIVLFFSPMY